ncbi:MAG: MMPL family transporter, partial [Myxococcota bacterium]|nr:MMPL family transporter [Myxococcota bacterium]
MGYESNEIKAMQALISTIIHLVTFKPRHVVAGSILVASLLTANIARTPLDLSFVSVFGDESDLMSKYVEMSQEVGLSRRLLLLLEGPDTTKLDAAASSIADALADSEDIDYVIAEPPSQWLADHAIWLVDEPTLDLWLKWVTSSNQSDTWQALQDALIEASEASSPLTADGARLVIVGLATDPLNIPVEDVVAGRNAYANVEGLVRQVLAGHEGVRGEFAGLGALASQDQKATLEAIGLISPLGLLAVLFLLRLVERSWSRLALMGLPLVLAAGATLGMVGWILGVITFTESFFGVLVFGLGIDFALHLLLRIREERVSQPNFASALEKALRGAGPGIILGALTTVAAFTLIATAPDPVARHLGVSGALGILTCLILMLTFLPAGLTLLERRNPSAHPSPFAFSPIHSMTTLALRSPKTTLALAGLLVALALAGSPRFHFERDLQKLFNRGVQAVETGERLRERFGTTNTPWVVASTNEREARGVEEAFRRDPTFNRVTGI